MSNAYKMVPVEPTVEMIAALGFDGDVDIAVGHGAISMDLAKCYSAMLAAAPQPPALGGEPEVLGYLWQHRKGAKYGTYVDVNPLTGRQDECDDFSKTEMIDRAQLAPLQAEIEQTKGLLKAYMNAEAEKGIELVKLRSERDQLKALLKDCRWRIVNKDVSTDDYKRLDKPVVDRIDAALSKPAGSDTTLTDFGPEHTWTCGTCKTEQPTDRACDVCNVSTEPAARECCSPTADEKAWLAAGECTPEELWGGPRPTCPKCIGSEKV